MIKDLTHMKSGQEGIVTSLRGGHGMLSRLDALGIRSGVTLTKVSAQFMRGPVIVRVGSTQVAIGYGMARHVFVQITDKRENQ